MSVMVTMVLLNEATICAMPLWTFLLPLALMILIGSTTAFGSRERFSSFFGSAVAVAAAAASFLAPFGAWALAALGAAAGAASAPSVLAAALGAAASGATGA